MPIPTSAAPPKRTLLRDQIFERLLHAVVVGELEPGETLVDSQLEEWLGASRTPIREAIGRLANLGLVDVVPQKATKVAALDIVQFGQIIETLGALDTAVIREATPLLTDADRKQLKRIRTALEKGVAAGPSPQRTTDVFDLFRIFLDRYGNRTTLRLVERYSPHMQRIINHFGARIDTDAGFPQLYALIDSAVGGDAEAAAEASAAYFSSALIPFADGLAPGSKEEGTS